MSTPLADIRRFRAAIRVLEHELALGLRSQTACCGVTPAQCHLLLEVDRRGPITARELASALGLDKSTLSRTLDGLAEAALVARAPDPEDGRAQRVTLTAAGREAVRRIDGECDVTYRTVLELLPGRRRDAVIDATDLLAATLRSARQGSGEGAGRRRVGARPTRPRRLR